MEAWKPLSALWAEPPPQRPAGPLRRPCRVESLGQGEERLGVVGRGTDVDAGCRVAGLTGQPAARQGLPPRPTGVADQGGEEPLVGRPALLELRKRVVG